MIPKTFCITLKDTPKRTEHLISQLKKVKLLDADILQCVNGSKLGLKPVNPDTFDNPTTEKTMTFGAVGNFLAHINIWSMCQLRPENEFLILEDDAVFSDFFNEKFEELYSKLPSDWEFVYVGWLPYGEDVTDEVINDGIVKKRVSGTHAYLFKKHIIPALLDAAYPMQSTIDTQLMHKIRDKVNYYVFEQSLVGQKSYANGSDAEWLSLIYDWKEDAFNFKNSLYQKIEVGNGWYRAESDAVRAWRWTSTEFSMKVPEKTTSVKMRFVSNNDTNKLSVINNNETYVMDVKRGRQTAEFWVQDDCILTFKLERGFIPAQDGISTDNRSLGICVEDLKIGFGEIEIPINLSMI